MAKKVRIILARSLSGGTESQIGTIRALGLRKIRQSVEKSLTPQIRGMITKVAHLVKTEER